MSSNQIFKEKVNIDLLEKFLNIFNLNIKNIENNIIIKTNISNKHLEEFLKISNDIKNHYIISRQSYFNKITVPKLIVILRQILKSYDYKLTPCEKYFDNKKHKIYKIIKINKTPIISNIISFD